MSISCHNQKLTRRSMLGISGATVLGLQTRDLLSFDSSPKSSTADHVILFWNAGGMTHLDTWDPKPGRPGQGEFQPIQTSAAGISISGIFPKLARQMHRSALIRSVVGTHADHGLATYHVQTGHDLPSQFLTPPDLQHPGLGSIVTRARPLPNGIPPYVAIGGQPHTGGFLGREFDPVLIPDPTAALRNVSPKMIARYGDSTIGKGAILAKQLVEKGVRFVQVQRRGFDTHQMNFPAMENHASVMDPALATLIEDLAESGRLERTLVLVLSEFGRTPTINLDGGRDHWNTVFSCFVAGGGVRGGTVIGSSDADGAYPKDHPVPIADLHATVLFACGIDPHSAAYPSSVARVEREIGERMNGSPVTELFAS